MHDSLTESPEDFTEKKSPKGVSKPPVADSYGFDDVPQKQQGGEHKSQGTS